MSLLHRAEYKKIKCNSCGAFNKIEWNNAVILIIFSLISVENIKRYDLSLLW